MENETRRRRKQQTPATRPPTNVHDIPDHLLHDIIVNRLRCHVSVIRVAAVCKRWRQIASTRGKNYPDWDRHDFFTCIGHYHAADGTGPQQRRRHEFVPVSRTIKARHFALDFLPTGPGGRPWELVDGSGSLLLLAVQRRGLFPDLVVCEPITRRYVRIHPIPEMKYFRCLGAFLGHSHNVISMSGFTVTCVLCDQSGGMEMEDGVSVVTARVYNHRASPNPPTRVKNGWDMSRAASLDVHVRGAESAHFAGRWRGSAFLGLEDDGTVICLQRYSARLSHFRLPEHVRESYDKSTFRFVEDVHVHRHPAMFWLVSLFSDELRVFVERKQNHGRSEWMLEKSLCLPEATCELPGHKESYFGRTAKIVTASRGFVVLTPAEETWLFSVKLRTMRVERDHVWKNRVPGEVYAYEFQTRPKVNASVVECKRGRGSVCRQFCKCK